MSRTDRLTAAAAPSARQVRQFTKALTASLTGHRERGPDRKVRRGSYDVADRRAKVFRPIGDGTAAGALSWIDCLLKVVGEWDDAERQKGGKRPLGLHAMRVLEVLLGRRGTVQPEFRSGRLEPAIDTIARVARLSRTTVIKALARLRGLKILDWVRRTETTDNDGRFGPQRRQVSNAYFFTPDRLPARVMQRLRDLVARRRLKRQAAAPPPPDQPPRPTDPELRASLDRLGQRLHASPPSGQYPYSGVEG